MPSLWDRILNFVGLETTEQQNLRELVAAEDWSRSQYSQADLGALSTMAGARPQHEAKAEQGRLEDGWDLRETEGIRAADQHLDEVFGRRQSHADDREGREEFDPAATKALFAEWTADYAAAKERDAGKEGFWRIPNEPSKSQGLEPDEQEIERER